MTDTTEKRIEEFKRLKDPTIEGGYDHVFTWLRHTLTSTQEETRRAERERIKQWALNDATDCVVERTGIYPSSAILVDELLQTLTKEQ